MACYVNLILPPATVTSTGADITASVTTAAPTGAFIGANHEAAPDDNLLTASRNLQAPQSEFRAGELADDSPGQWVDTVSVNSKLEPISLTAATELDRANTLHIDNFKEAPAVSAYKPSFVPQIQAPLTSHSEQEQVSPVSAPTLNHASSATVVC